MKTTKTTMTNPFSKTMRRTAGVLFAVLFCCGGGRAQETGAGAEPADYDQLVVNANSFLKQGKLDQAQQTAKRALKLEARRYEAYAVAAKIASERGAGEEAASLIAKAVELAPEESKAKVRQLAGMLAQGSTATQPPVAGALSNQDRLKLDGYMLILEDAQKATTSQERSTAFREFLDKSAGFAKAHPEQTNLWVMRAFAAVDLNDPAAGWPAGKQLKALGMIDSDDAKVHRVMAELERKGWLSEPPTPPQAGQPWTNSLGMEFVPVPGTEVLFCVWDARLKDFEAFVNATGYDATVGMLSLRGDGWQRREDTWKSPGFSQGPTHPVCGVSWEDAQAFCRWLGEKEQRGGSIGREQSYRLPTDAEWSAAVGLSEESGGSARDKQMQVKGVYPWGTDWPPPEGAGNYAGSEAADADWPSDFTTIEGYRDGYARTSPVGSFRPNRFGLYDMGGNVWQWCEDWFDGGQKIRVLRGASWRASDPRNLLSSCRGSNLPDHRLDNLGFRCVLVVGSVRQAL